MFIPTMEGVVLVGGRLSNNSLIVTIPIINTFLHVLSTLSSQLTLIWHDGGDCHCEPVKAEPAQSRTKLISVFPHLTSPAGVDTETCTEA